MFCFFVFLDGIHVTHCYSNTVAIQPLFFEVCSNDLALAVSRFFTDVSVSDNRLVTIGICCARTVSEDCCTRLCE